MNSVLDYLENVDDFAKVVEKNKTKCYKEIRNNSKVIGSNLKDYVKKNKPVAVFMEKGINTLEVFFASLYAGGFYSLLNVGLPLARLMQIVNVLDVKFIVTDRLHYDEAVEIFKDIEILVYEDLVSGIVDEEYLADIRKLMIDTDPVYANFTSGSTGVPKGVLVSHRSIIDFINVFTDEFNITKKDVIGNQAPFDFDVSVKDIYSSLKTGATLVIIPKELFSRPAELMDYLVLENVTTLIWAVSALTLLSTFHALDYKSLESVDKVLFSGEVMPKRQLDIWMSHLPWATFVNLYGPTEITCNVTYHVIDKTREYEKIPLGCPFINESILLINDEGLVIKDEEIGEIVVRGTALSLGYYKNMNQTKKVFVQNPLHNDYLDLVYKTGDLAYYKNGELYFAGRKDFQVKYMGHRIELEEIDLNICKVQGVEISVTMFIEDKGKLVTFYSGDIDVTRLRDCLISKLPKYMIPGKFVKVSEFPLNKNGKIDRKELMNSL